MTENENVRNVLLIGRTGGGKSTLGNVLINKNNEFEEVFKESSQSVSATKDVKEATVEIDLARDGSEKVRYRIIDTIGIGDTKLTPQGVLIKLAEMAGRVKDEGLNHILFVTQGRFTKEEIEAYDLLSSVIFDLDVIKYTTVIRTNFPNFENEEACADDRAKLRMENADLSHILNRVNIIYVDNPSIDIIGSGRRVEAQIAINKEIREESRKKMLTYLATCQGNYRPNNIDTLDERVNEYKTNEQKLKAKMKELEKSRKEQEEKFRQEIANLKEEQARELRENRIKFEEDIRKVKVEGEDKLRTTVNTLEDKRRQDMENLESRNRQQISNLQADHQRQAQSIREAGEQQMRTIQAQVQQSQQETDRLRRELESKSSSSTSEITTLLAQMKADDRKWEQRRDEQRQEYERRQSDQQWQFQQQQLSLEERRIQAENDREDQRRRDEATARREAQQNEERHRREEAQRGANRQAEARAVQQRLDRQAEENRRLQRGREEEERWQERNRQYLIEQRNLWPPQRDKNWQAGLPRPDKK